MASISVDLELTVIATFLFWEKKQQRVCSVEGEGNGNRARCQPHVTGLKFSGWLSCCIVSNWGAGFGTIALCDPCKLLVSCQPFM